MGFGRARGARAGERGAGRARDSGAESARCRAPAGAARARAATGRGCVRRAAPGARGLALKGRAGALARGLAGLGWAGLHTRALRVRVAACSRPGGTATARAQQPTSRARRGCSRPRASAHARCKAREGVCVLVWRSLLGWLLGGRWAEGRGGLGRVAWCTRAARPAHTRARGRAGTHTHKRPRAARPRGRAMPALTMPRTHHAPGPTAAARPSRRGHRPHAPPRRRRRLGLAPRDGIAPDRRPPCALLLAPPSILLSRLFFSLLFSFLFCPFRSSHAGNSDYAFLEPTLAAHVESVAPSSTSIGARQAPAPAPLHQEHTPTTPTGRKSAALLLRRRPWC